MNLKSESCEILFVSKNVGISIIKASKFLVKTYFLIWENLFWENFHKIVVPVVIPKKNRIK